MKLRNHLSLAARVLAWGLLALVAVGLADGLLLLLGPLASFRLHLAVAAGVLFALALAFRARAVAVPSGLAALLAALTLGPVWQAPERPAAAPGQTVTVLFANVYSRNPAPAAMQMALLAEDADVVVVTEVPDALAGGPLDRRYPYRVAGAESGDAAELTPTAIWSRYPLENGATNRIAGIAPRAATAVVRIAEGTRLRLLGLHFSRVKSRQVRRQLESLGELGPWLEPPLAIVGDFNAPPWGHLVRRAAEVTGTEVAPGYRVTWRGEYPVIGLPSVLGHSIDHLLVSPGVGIASLETVEIPGSDHLGLLAELVVPPTEEPAAEPAAGLSPAVASDYVPAVGR